MHDSATAGQYEARKMRRLAIRTPRLDLVPMTPVLMRAVLARDWSSGGHLAGAEWPQEWRDDGWPWLQRHLDAAERDLASTAWGPRLVLRRGEDGRPVLVAEAGFHGPPDAEGGVEFGYMVEAAHRRLGIAEEAARGLLAWAGNWPALHYVCAVVDPGNDASLGLLAKLGFALAGLVDHPDRGKQLVLRRGL